MDEAQVATARFGVCEETPPPPPKSTTPAQEYAEYIRENDIRDMSFREFQEHKQHLQKMELYDTSLLDL
ncbi:MAG: hypothetical protein ACKPKO_48820 [Candidatus Fonsibacter sp.]